MVFSVNKGNAIFLAFGSFIGVCDLSSVDESVVSF